MGKCKGIGRGEASAKARNRDEAKHAAKLSAFGKAQAEAEMDANSDCPDGHCTGTYKAYPTVTYEGRTKNGKHKYRASTFVVLRGNCVSTKPESPISPKASPKVEPKQKEERNGCIKSIKSENYQDFMKEVRKLPKWSKRIEDKCCMYRKKVNGLIWVPVAGGNCDDGECVLIIRMEGDKMSAQVICD